MELVVSFRPLVPCGIVVISLSSHSSEGALFFRRGSWQFLRVWNFPRSRSSQRLTKHLQAGAQCVGCWEAWLLLRI